MPCHRFATHAFCVGKRWISRTTGSFRRGTRKICATANAVSLRQARRNLPDERKGRGPISASNNLSAGNATPGLTRARVSPATNMATPAANIATVVIATTAPPKRGRSGNYPPMCLPWAQRVRAGNRCGLDTGAKLFPKSARRTFLGLGSRLCFRDTARCTLDKD